MTDADKLERIRSIVADHYAYGLSRHHEMVLDITDVLAEEEPEGGADLYDPKTSAVLAHPAQKLAVKAFDAERRVLDAMGEVPENNVRAIVNGSINLRGLPKAFAAELERRGLKP